MSDKALAFHGGVRLWQYAQTMPPGATPGPAARQGTRRKLQNLNPKSPNWAITVLVPCSIRPADATAWATRQTALHLQLDEVSIRLRAISQVLQDLSWCQNEDDRASVVGGPYGTGVQDLQHGAIDAGNTWTPTVGHYVLARNPLSGEGFVRPALAIGSSPDSIRLDCPVAVDTNWELRSVQRCYPLTRWSQWAVTPSSSPAADFHRTGGGVVYTFEGMADPLIASDLQPDVS